MKPWVLIDTASIPGGGQLRLLRRGDEFSMRLDGSELMGSRVRGSEEALARLGCARLRSKDRPSILIGGLGMGFTLRATLDLVGEEARITVAELLPAVVAWNHGPMAGLSGGSLSDPRVTVLESDVGEIIRSQSSAYDAIVLDVDNGPAGLTRHANDRLYGVEGLRASREALRPGGLLAVWSAATEPWFTHRLRDTGFGVTEHIVRSQGNRGARHVIWIAEHAVRSQLASRQAAHPFG